jgi:hypothetical protein
VRHRSGERGRGQDGMISPGIAAISRPPVSVSSPIPFLLQATERSFGHATTDQEAWDCPAVSAGFRTATPAQPRSIDRWAWRSVKARPRTTVKAAQRPAPADRLGDRTSLRRPGRSDRTSVEGGWRDLPAGYTSPGCGTSPGSTGGRPAAGGPGARSPCGTDGACAAPVGRSRRSLPPWESPRAFAPGRPRSVSRPARWSPCVRIARGSPPPQVPRPGPRGH